MRACVRMLRIKLSVLIVTVEQSVLQLFHVSAVILVGVTVTTIPSLQQHRLSSTTSLLLLGRRRYGQLSITATRKC